ncbi:MAG: hypothetical protein RLZZ490_1007 [Cyanobacteriota bacterium]|jgi:uncharacterized membrane protein
MALSERRSPDNWFPPRLFWTLMVLVAFGLFASASVRHYLFQSNALDLGWFDQAIYLISQGQLPIVSFRGFHILGDHAAGIVYPLALFYKLYPSVYSLLALQAIALAVGAWPTWQLARQLGLGEQESLTMAGVYWLYPLVFNVNLFDFHPEVFALPALLWLVWSARGKRWGFFLIALAVILASKAVLSLTVTMVGFWLMFWEKRRGFGIVSLFAGVAWFLIATKGIIPAFSGGEAAAVNRYSFLGDSVGEIALNLILKPHIILSYLLTTANFFYLLLLIIPVAWGVWGRAWMMVIPAIPALFLNLITDYNPQKNLVFQYALPILPFLLLMVMTHWQQGTTWLKRPRWILTWAAIAFLALAKYTFFLGPYWQHWGDLSDLHTAVSLVQPGDRLLTAPHLAPHLTHRPDLQLVIRDEAPFDLEKFDSILLQTNHAGWPDSENTVAELQQQLQQSPQFKPIYQQENVVLYRR